MVQNDFIVGCKGERVYTPPQFLGPGAEIPVYLSRKMEAHDLVLPSVFAYGAALACAPSKGNFVVPGRKKGANE